MTTLGEGKGWETTTPQAPPSRAVCGYDKSATWDKDDSARQEKERLG